MKLVNAALANAQPAAAEQGSTISSAMQSFVREAAVLLHTAKGCSYTAKAYGLTVKDGRPGIVMKPYNRGDLSTVIPAGKCCSREMRRCQDAAT